MPNRTNLLLDTGKFLPYNNRQELTYIVQKDIPVTKTITFDRETRDFRAELNGVLIGYFRTRLEAETALDNAAYEELARG